MKAEIERENQEYNNDSRRTETLIKPAIIAGKIAVYGAGGYLVAKGLDAFVFDLDNSSSFVAILTAGGAALGAYHESQE